MEQAYIPHYDTRVEQLEKDIAQVLALPVTHQLRLLMEHVQLDPKKTIGDVKATRWFANIIRRKWNDAEKISH